MSALPPAVVAEPLLASITSARWFAGKGRRAELRSLTPLPWLNDSGAGSPQVRIEIAEIGYPDEGTTEYYQLALAYRDVAVRSLADAELFTNGDRTVYDAMQDPEAARVLLTALRQARSVDATGASIRFHRLDDGQLEPDLVSQVFGGQQSNTSLSYGEVAMLKLFRRLELGRNLDIEVHAALNEQGVRDVARLYGWSEATWTRDGEVLGADLSMYVEKLADATDGWILALAALTEEDRLGAASPGAGFTEQAQALGTALALTHQALRTAFGTATLPAASVATTMTRRLAAAVSAAPVLGAYAPALESCFDDLGTADLDVQRVHGDFHLGQTLHTPSGWRIIDFEGEPAKSLPERAAPDTVWRDVAGMLRSFGYAAASVGGPAATGWEHACRAAFLSGYSGGRALTATERVQLRAYEADKSIYEVVYEVRNRPDWAAIPLKALDALTRDPDPTQEFQERR